MSATDYLKDHREAILALTAGLVLFSLAFLLDPGVHLSTVLYLDALAVIAASLWHVHHYHVTKKHLAALLTQLGAPLDTPLVAPAGSPTCLQRLTAAFDDSRAHYQQEQNQVLTQQADQRAYVEAWVHDIKVPLAAAELLCERLSDEESQEPLQQQLASVDNYVEQALYYARLDQFSADYLIQPTALAPLVTDLVSNMSTGFIMKRIGFSLTGEVAPVLSDAKWLTFIVRQLLNNALTYTPAGGQIKVTLTQTVSATHLTVSDTGIGIEKAELHRVFDKGFTGSNGRDVNHNATGIGLYLAKQLTQKLGHELTITSQKKVGTNVTLSFPSIHGFTNQ